MLTQTRGQTLPLTRAGVWVLFVLAAANGLFLYLLPARAGFDYAWSIKPPVNAAFIGAGFVAGTVATGLVLFTHAPWRAYRLLPPALWVLATSLFAATLIHHDRFKFHYAPTYVWLVVYAGGPLGVPGLGMLQRRDAEPVPAADPRLRTVRVLSAVCGVVLLVGAVAVF